MGTNKSPRRRKGEPPPPTPSRVSYDPPTSLRPHPTLPPTHPVVRLHELLAQRDALDWSDAVSPSFCGSGGGASFPLLVFFRGVFFKVPPPTPSLRASSPQDVETFFTGIGHPEVTAACRGPSVRPHNPSGQSAEAMSIG